MRADRHPALLRPDDTLLVVIDMQEPVLRGVWERERVIDNVSRLIRAAGVLLVPLVATLQNRERLGESVPEIGDLLPPQCPCFEKMSFSCLGAPAFKERLRYAGRRQVLLCGVETHVCISQTAHDLLAGGWQVHVAADAVSSRTQANRDLALRRLAQAGAVVTSTEAALFELLGEAGTDQFRQVLKLVK